MHKRQRTASSANSNFGGYFREKYDPIAQNTESRVHQWPEIPGTRYQGPPEHGGEEEGNEQTLYRRNQRGDF